MDTQLAFGPEQPLLPGRISDLKKVGTVRVHPLGGPGQNGKRLSYDSAHKAEYQSRDKIRLKRGCYFKAGQNVPL